MLWNVVNIVPLVVVFGIGCVLALVSLGVSFAISYVYLVLGSILHVAFFIHWLMTGDYYAGWIAPDHVRLAIASSVANLVVSDIGDLCVAVLDGILDAITAT